MRALFTTFDADSRAIVARGPQVLHMRASRRQKAKICSMVETLARFLAARAQPPGVLRSCLRIAQESLSGQPLAGLVADVWRSPGRTVEKAKLRGKFHW